MKPQPPSSAAASDPGSPEGSRIAGAVAALAGRAVLGLVWLDAALNVESGLGDLVGRLTPGRPVGELILPLLGCEDSIMALRRRPDSVLEMPNVAVRIDDGEPPRLNITVHWLAREQRYLVVMMRAIDQGALEMELIRSERARRLAEADLLAKSHELKRANGELARANADLEQFAYVISHDLSAPLRAIRLVAGDLERTLGENAGATAALAQVGVLRQQSERMRTMLTGLLAYSRIGRKADLVETVDVGALIEEIVRSLAAPPELRVVATDPFPILQTVRAPLDLVLRNLIDNAICHHDRRHGSVHISAQPHDAHVVLVVADDGPGIPVDAHRAIFEPFVKLDDEAHPEGAGIGLALVARTLSLIGGRISVESDPARSRGTRMVVIWPRELRDGRAPD
ncbi:MAG: HAMP domain-containing histidine kinase [Hyphomicrobiaceae bacterium]|nr:HAMP domain-containing histidine kinase [Hyphomicrobiaceae bacterium]